MTTKQPNRILVVGAHPADPFERAGGTMVNHLGAGDDVFVVSLTTGVVTHAFGMFPATGEDKLADIERVKAEKRNEFERASERLGATGSRLYEFSESPLLYGMDEYSTLVQLIREVRPNVVLCAHPVEVGRFDHMDSGSLVLRAIDYARADGFPNSLQPHVVGNILFFHYDNYQSEQLMGTARRSPDVIIDTSNAYETKLELMSIFGTTQTKTGEDYQKRMRLFLDRVDGAVGYRHLFGDGAGGHGEQFVRWNPVLGQLLPLR